MIASRTTAARVTPSQWLRHRAGATGDRGAIDGEDICSIPAQDLVGRWGLAAYHKEEDRSRTEAAARGQCKQPWNTRRGPRGGVIMHSPTSPSRLSSASRVDRRRGTPSAPARSPLAVRATVRSSRSSASSPITRFIDPEVSGRYGADN